jgi:hypothetical protein
MKYWEPAFIWKYRYLYNYSIQHYSERNVSGNHGAELRILINNEKRAYLQMPNLSYFYDFAFSATYHM